MRRTALIAVCAALLAGSAFAQSGHHGHHGHHAAPASAMVTPSIPDKAVLTAAPARLTLTLAHAATVSSVRLTTATGEAVPLPTTLPKGPQTKLDVPLPRLDPDDYRLTWRLIAEDGHAMAGQTSFTVRPSP